MARRRRTVGVLVGMFACVRAAPSGAAGAVVYLWLRAPARAERPPRVGGRHRRRPYRGLRGVHAPAPILGVRLGPPRDVGQRAQGLARGALARHGPRHIRRLASSQPKRRLHPRPRRHRGAGQRPQRSASGPDDDGRPGAGRLPVAGLGFGGPGLALARRPAPSCRWRLGRLFPGEVNPMPLPGGLACLRTMLARTAEARSVSRRRRGPFSAPPRSS